MPDCVAITGGTGLSATALTYGPALVGLVVLLALAAALFAFLARRNSAMASAWERVRRRPLPTAGVLLALLALLAVLIYAWRAGEHDSAIARQVGLVQAGNNLLANPQLSGQNRDKAPATWEISGTARLVNGVATEISGQASSSLIWVRPGASYCYSIRGTSTTPAQTLLEWHASAPRTIISWQVAALSGQPGFIQGTVTAPQGARFLRVLLRSSGEPLSVDFVRVAEAGVRVAQWPNGARAALAFSFDWESAMGGLIHSWAYATHDVADATQRGLNMRAGADFLLDLFAKNEVRGTFYATGYNLIDGNTEQRTFAGNPTYSWANTKNRWASNYWTSHPWYGDDPFSTFKDAPAWYFGDQTRRMMAAGQEIGSHTFGHLYVRGTTPQQLQDDAAEWDHAADAIGLAHPTAFAFPWQSSNSVTADFFQVLASHGISSVTRLYPLQLQREQELYQITALSVYTPFAVMPDFMLGPASPGGEAGAGQVTPDRAQAIIDDTIARGGATSFWNHPEVLVQRDAQAAWRTVVAYAASKVAAGDLYVAPVGQIVQYQRDMDKVAVRIVSSGDPLRLEITNGAARTLDGVTLTLPGAASSATAAGAAVKLPRPDTLVLPPLNAGETLTIEVKMRAAD